MLPLKSFEQFISTHTLFTVNHKILLTVSGGKDSVLMVHLFKEAGIMFGIAHCNFNLRAEESKRDEHFVSQLAEKLEVPFHLVNFNTKGYAAAHSMSTQMAARDLRYEWFEKTRQEEKYDYIAVAHHQNDVIETVLLNLTRGTGISGLHGILPKRGFIVRPLLFLNSDQINDLIRDNQLSFVEDSSNSKDAYARNRLRHHVIPQLKQINKNLEKTFQQNVARFSETEIVLKNVVKDLKKKIVQVEQNGSLLSFVKISIEDIKSLVPQRLLLYELLLDYNFSESIIGDVLQVLDHQSGTSFFSDTHRLTIDRKHLIITVIPFASGAATYLGAEDQIVSLEHHLIFKSLSKTNEYGSDPGFAYVDADLLIYPLVIRTRVEGDRFIPLGMRTFKKLSNYFIDQKVSLPQKENIPLLVNGNGEIIWVAGMRQDNRYKVTATTKKVVIFELKLK